MKINEFRTIREKYKLRQEDMACKLKVSLSHYSKLEGHFVNPSFDVLLRFKQVFPEADMNNFFKKEKA